MDLNTTRIESTVPPAIVDLCVEDLKLDDVRVVKWDDPTLHAMGSLTGCPGLCSSPCGCTSSDFSKGK